MVIGFDGSRAFSENRTGTENYSYQLLKALAKIDKKNTYKVFLRPGSVVPTFVPPLPSLRVNKVKRGNLDLDLNQDSYDPIKSDLGMTNNHGWPENFKFITLGFWYLWTQAGLAAQTFVEPMDVLFVPAHTLPLIRKPGLKTVVTVHDLGSEYLPQTHQLKQRLYLSFMQKYQLETATKLIAVSNATKQDLIKKLNIPNPAEDIQVVYEGYDENRFKIHDSRFKSGEELEKILKTAQLTKNGYFLFVGTVQPRKNLARIIEAFANISSLRDHKMVKQSSSKIEIATSAVPPRNDGLSLVIVGKKGWLSDEIYALPKKLGIEERVKFLDYVKDKDLPALYSGAIALVYPSLFEGFGLPILEAQACGTPVITSNLSSMPEVAGEGAILVDPYSIEEIADAMINVASHKSQVTSKKRENLIREGFKNVQRFSWEKCARETLEVLESF